MTVEEKRVSPAGPGIITGILMILVSGIFYASSLATNTPRGLPVSPMLWPKVVICALGICGLLLMASSIREARGAIAVLEHSGSTERALNRSNGDRAKAFVPFLLVFLYVYLMGKTGYFLTSLTVCALLMLSLGERRLRFLIPVPLAFTGLMWVFFTQITVIPLPLGVGPFRALSLFVTYGL